MKNYVVVYKLTYSENRYLNLVNYLKSFKYWARPVDNTWIIKSTLTASQLRDGIKPHILKTDKVAVIALAEKEWGTFNIDKRVTEWMHGSL